MAAAVYCLLGRQLRPRVEEVTFAGNLLDMYAGIQAVGNDLLTRGSRQCGSILLERMTIAGE